MSVLKEKFTVAIMLDFLQAFSKLPQAQQQKVWRFVEKFRTAPDSTGINYETIRNVKDKNLRSVRIGDDYRAIVLKPDKGNVYVLMWVAHHDDAYQWAENKVCKINPQSGSLQVIDVESTQAAELNLEERRAEEPSKPSTPEKLKKTVEPKSDLTIREPVFQDVADDQLVRLGVPEDYLARIRAIRTDGDVDALCKELPEEASEALIMLAAGYSINDVFAEIEKAPVPESVIDTQDFAAALDNMDSKRRFYVVEDERELAAILNAPLEQWRIFLHPSQRKMVERNWSGPVRILGGAGTGKTVVAMHRARWLAQHIFTNNNDRILFTTFTANLASDIRANLETLCPPDVMQRIDVVHIDKWVSDFLARNGYKYKIVYEDQTKDLWERAMGLRHPDVDLDERFYREEWEQVVQQQAISDRDTYLRASRLGRGEALSRKDRDKIWDVFEEYRTQLNDRQYREFVDATRDALNILTQKGNVLPYKAVIVDEAQDMGPAVFCLIRKMVPEAPNDIFIVGDAHQRIYGRKASLGACGINIRGRSKKLRINYRTTDETRKWAVALLSGVTVDDLDGGSDDLKGYKSLMHGDAPIIEHFKSFEQEVDFIGKTISTLKDDSGTMSNICLISRRDDLSQKYQKALAEKGIPTYIIRRSVPDERKQPGVRLATMHRVKGLQFDYVLLVAVNAGEVPYEYLMEQASNAVAKRQLEQQERSLLHVAATRAKKSVFISSHGQPSRFLSDERQVTATTASKASG